MRRPWNIVDSPVYSLAVSGPEGFNMNICTYVTAVSMKPKIYAIAIDLKSKTQQLLKQTDMVVLQILGKQQSKLVRPLGQKSGRTFDKEAYLNKHDHLASWKNHSVLRDPAAYLLLRKAGSQVTGDHELYWFQTESFKTNHESVLMFQELIDQKIILS